MNSKFKDILLLPRKDAQRMTFFPSNTNSRHSSQFGHMNRCWSPELHLQVVKVKHIISTCHSYLTFQERDQFSFTKTLGHFSKLFSPCNLTVCVFKFYFPYIVPSVLLFREIKSLFKSFTEIPLAVVVFWAVNRTKLGIFHLSSVLKVQILECWSNNRLQSPSTVIPIKYNFYIISHVIVSLQECKFVSLVLVLLDDVNLNFKCFFDHQGIKSDMQTEFAHSEHHLSR